MDEQELKVSSSFNSDATFNKPPIAKSQLNKVSTPSFSEKSETIASPSKSRVCFQKTISILKSALKKYWFLLGLAFVIILAWLFPDVSRKGGYIRAEWSIKWGKQ